MAVIVKINGIAFGGFRCTNHFRTYFSGDWDVHRGTGCFSLGFTHFYTATCSKPGQMKVGKDNPGHKWVRISALLILYMVLGRPNSVPHR